MANDKWEKGHNKEKFNRAAEKTVPHKKGLNDAAVKAELEKYAKAAKSKSPQRETMQQMTEKFKAAELSRNNNRIRVIDNFRQGKKAGIHQEKTSEELSKNLKKSDQQMRDNAMKEAKRYYRDNIGVAKKFNKEATKTKSPRPRKR